MPRKKNKRHNTSIAPISAVGVEVPTVKEKKKEVEPELPNLDPYNKDIYFKIYFPDLFADILLLVFSFFISHELFSERGLFVRLQPWHISAMYSIVTLTVPWYLGYLYVHNKSYYEKGIMKLLLWLFCIMVVMILINLIRLVFKMEGIMDPEFMNNPTGFTAVFSMFLLVIGPMMSIGGGMAADDEKDEIKNGPTKFDPSNASVTGVFAILIIAIAAMIYIIGQFGEGAGGWVVIVGFLGGPLVAVIVYGIFLKLIMLLDGLGIYQYLKLFATNSFPFFIIAVLVFWSGVAVHFMMEDFANSAGRLSRGGMLFALCVSGLIPFRIFMMFNAPLRLINIIIGICTVAYFIIQMMMLTI